MKTEMKKLEKSQIEIHFYLSAEEFKTYFTKTLVQMKEHIKINGFRKGHVPLDVVENKIGENNLLMEAGDLAVKTAYSEFIEEKKLEPIDLPEVQILKIAKGSDFEFTVKVSLMPEIKLPDYRNIASQIKPKEIFVTEQELQDALIYLQKSRAKFFKENRGAMANDFVEIEYQNKDINNGKIIKDRFILGQGGFLKDFENNIVNMKEGELKTFSSKFPENMPNKELAGKDAQFSVKMISVQRMELPQINDEFAKSLGNFLNLADLKKSLKEGIMLEKKENEKQRSRTEILEIIAQSSDFEIPEKMIVSEQERLFENLKNQTENQLKINFENYLKSINKTEEELKDSFKLVAKKRIKNFLILRQIGKQENIKVTKEEIDQETEKILKNYSKEQLEKIDIGQLKEYSKEAIYNEKVFQLLENFSE